MRPMQSQTIPPKKKHNPDFLGVWFADFGGMIRGYDSGYDSGVWFAQIAQIELPAFTKNCTHQKKTGPYIYIYYVFNYRYLILFIQCSELKHPTNTGHVFVTVSNMTTSTAIWVPWLDALRRCTNCASASSCVLQAKQQLRRHLRWQDLAINRSESETLWNHMNIIWI